MKLLSSLNQILKESPDTRIFVTGRSHIQTEIGKRLSGRVTSISITHGRDGIISYLRSKLDEATISDAMDSSLEADILKKISKDISEMYVQTPKLGKLSKSYLLIDIYLDSY